MKELRHTYRQTLIEASSRLLCLEQQVDVLWLVRMRDVSEKNTRVVLLSG